jgi:hypothetical protein
MARLSGAVGFTASPLLSEALEGRGNFAGGHPEIAQPLQMKLLLDDLARSSWENRRWGESPQAPRRCRRPSD